jgi:murein DD-endopeptidase MepM/ murein hydrolase activator NlpD
MAPCYTNRVVIEHADGVCTVYLNIKQHSAKEGVLVGRTVRRGQVIAQVGNSGGGSEPHLQFMAVRFLPDGRAEPVPVTFENAYHDVAGEQRVVGVPLGGRLYHFIDRPNGNGGR